MQLSLPRAIATGTPAAATRNGAASLVTREDCARAAATALTLRPGKFRALEIMGSGAITAADAARLGSMIIGKPVRFVNVAPEELKVGLLKANLPELVADIVVAFHREIATRQLGPASGDFTALTGRAITSVKDYLHANRELLLRGT
jgi:NAD(P)H dehydrogenase (quinone)